jgi:hypothetical protein
MNVGCAACEEDCQLTEEPNLQDKL